MTQRLAESMGVPYDPDMDVREALRLGRVAVVDSGQIGSGDYAPCMHPAPTTAMAAAGVNCTRMAGHKGVHAHVLRWDMSHVEVAQQQKALEDERRKREEALKRLEREQRQIKEAQAKVMAEKAKEARKAMESLHREFARLDSMTYGPQQPKNQRFRDQNVGKLRGKR